MERNIPGWGMDADPANNPTYPMKKYDGSDHERLNYQRPFQQATTVEVLHSNERPGLTSVFGTSVPVRENLSGRLRRYAFRHSESSYAHWFPLVLADRIDVIAAIVEDLRKGIVPNLFAEKGCASEWKYNKKAVLKKAAIIAGVAALIILMKRRKGSLA